jgi:hypothetical protein
MGKPSNNMNCPMGDERRRDFRSDVPLIVSVDMQVALSYQPVDSIPELQRSWQWDDLAVSPDLVKSMVNQTDLPTQEPLLLQMLTRIDWMLTTVMKTLAKEGSAHHAFPDFITANLSGSGIRFPARQEFRVGDLISLKLVLRPFVPIQAVGRILRVSPVLNDGVRCYETACEFAEIMTDDREAIIRHVIRSQAVLQRRRSLQEGLTVL